MSTAVDAFAIGPDADDAPRVVDASPSRWRRWALCVALFGCFFFATQDVNSPIVWRGVDEGRAQDFIDRVAQGQAARQVGFLALAGLSTLAILLPDRRPIVRRVDWLVVYPLVALVAWSFASLLWSHDAALTAKRLVVFAAFALATVAIAKHFTLRDVVAATIFYGLASYAVGLYAELASGLGLAAGPDGFRLAGAMHPNHLGLTSAVLALAALHGWTTSRTGGRRACFAAMIVLAVVVLLLTKSRTSLAAGVVAFGLMAGLRSRPAAAMGVLLAGLCLFGLGLFLVEAGVLGPVWEAALLGRQTSNVRTLTGRTDIWAYALRVLLADPARLLVGFGHDTFWNETHTAGVSRAVGYSISEAHNAYLERMLNLGIVGLLCATTASVAAGWRWLATGRTRRGRWRADAAFAVALIFLSLVHGVAESTFAHAQFVTLMLFACLALAAARPVDLADDSRRVA